MAGSSTGKSGEAVAALAPGDTLREAASRLIWEGSEALPVVEDGAVVGSVRAGDVWRAGGRA